MATDRRATRRSRRGRNGPGRQRACTGAPHHAERRERRWPRPRLSALYLTGVGAVLPILVVPVGWPTVLAVVLLVAGAATIAAGVRARRRHQARAAAVERAAQGYVEQVLALVWEDWICAEASRGQRQLERWRDTHRL